MLDEILIIIVRGIAIGSIFSTIAMSFNIVHGATGILNFAQGNMLVLAGCCKCHGKYVVNALDLNDDYQCGLCNMPSRAGKTRKAKDAAALAAA